MSKGLTILSRLKKQYLRIRLTEILLLAIGVMLLIWSTCTVFNSSKPLQAIATIICGIAAFSIRFMQIGLHRTSEKSIVSFLNVKYEEFHASADLALTSEGNLTTLVRIQQLKTEQKLESLSGQIRFPNHIMLFAILAIISFTMFLFIHLNGFEVKTKSVSGMPDEKQPDNSSIKNIPAEISEVKVLVSPPSYTRIQQYASTDLNLQIAENSQVSWTLTFSLPIKEASIVTASQDTLKFKFNNNSWKLTTTLERNGFYQLVWKDHGTHSSDYYKIDVIKDQPPIIKLSSLNQFTQVTFDSRQSIEANPVISDDYGLTDAYIIATVSKGSGESVKFREEKIRFSTPQQISGKQINSKRTLNLKTLGLEPGDELYFYVEALDNKSPLANRTRTETYFIAIPDTVQDVMTADGGLGVDLMPEYFRSQRQIIIDTEKLIREKKVTDKKEFNFKSNELGYDQKVLRLRYGQFMGEEAESGIVPIENHADEDDHEETKAEDLAKEFGHQHDTENEHNLVDEKNPAKKDVDGAKKEDPFAEFVHQHDNEESATFFIQSLKLKLKAALAQMWDAELYLRIYEPEKSLPYQYTALKLLKEISNDSRIYVHRTGFEPPPIKEEKRLSADLNEIFNASRSYEADIKKYFPKISEALRLTEKLLAKEAVRVSPSEKNIILQSGSELAQAALENPSLLEGLTALRTLTDNQVDKDITKQLKLLKNAYWTALPKQPVQSSRQNSSLHALDEQLILQLEILEP
jgi:hypothetical protein